MADERPLDGLDEAPDALLAEFDRTLGRLHDLREAAAASWAQKDKAETAEEAWKLSMPLLDRLEEEPDAPYAPLLTDHLWQALENVIDDPLAGPGVILKQEAAGESAKRGRGAADCCLTRVRFRNLTDQPVRVTASGPLGTTAQEVFGPGRRRTLRRKDDRDGSTIPGGLGRCVKITVEVASSAEGENRWVKLIDEVEVCCDRNRQGDKLSFTSPPREDGTRPRPRELLEIVEIEAISPCPESRGGMAQGGARGHWVQEVPGLEVPDKGHFVGGHAVFVFVAPENCRQFCFIQAAKRTVTIDGRPTGATHDWRLDLERGQRSICYKYQGDRPEGGRSMNDSPGLVNPWGRVRLPDGTLLTPRRGQVIRARWEFRTWAVCLRPFAILGQYSWTLTVTVPVPARRPARGQPIPGVDTDLPEPGFHAGGSLPQNDRDLFRRLVGR